MTPGTNVWARALGVGTNSMILLAVNDTATNDMAGCHYTPVTNATVTVTLPSWMQYPTAFEISASGLSAVTLQTNGNQLQVNLGTLDVTRMIVLTRDAQLQAAIQQRYTQLVQPGVCSFAPESCVNEPPGITQQPGDQFVLPGAAAAFSVVASGTSPLSYQWQKNQLNMADGGHYSGCATAVLAVSGVDSTDVASYRCVVTNAYGSVTSSVAALTLVTNAFVLSTLAAVPTLSGDATNEARAITPDGLWVAGISGTRGFLYDVAGGHVYNVLDPFGAQSTIAAGVCYRTSGGQQQVIVGGMAAGWNADYCFTNGTAFAQVRRDNNYGSSGQSPAIGIANVRVSGGGDVFWGGWGDLGSSWEFMAVGKVSGTWQGPNTAVATDKTASLGTTAFGVYGISATGRAVGYRNSTRAHYVLDWTGKGTPTNWSFNGLNGTTAGAAYAISTNGTAIFGQSPVSGGRPGNWGYKAAVSSASPGVFQSITELPSFPETVGTAGSASLPYGCTGDGKYAVGMSYRGTEKAVLWDTHDASATNWTVVDLTDLALAKGALGIFSRLARAYSVGTNGTGNLVVAGMGLDTNSPANTRAFLMTVGPLSAAVVSRPAVTISIPYPAEFKFSFLTSTNASLTYYLDVHNQPDSARCLDYACLGPGKRNHSQPV